MKWQKPVAVALALALAMGGGARWLHGRASQGPDQGQAGAPATASSAAVVPDPHAVLAEWAVRGVPPGASASAALTSSARLEQRLSADWCGVLAAEAGRAQAAARASSAASAADTAVSPELEAAMSQLREQAAGDALQRWADVLRRNGDLRSRALADYLLPDGPARMRLQRYARTSTDPMVTALALQRPCGPGVCVNVEPAQWSRLEPANLQGWLLLMQSPGTTQQAYALDRAASEARYSRSYEREMLAQLMRLPMTQAPGLAAQAEVEVLHSLRASWAVPGYRGLAAVCLNGVNEPQTLARCAAVADLLWAQDNQLERSMALAAARIVLRHQPASRPVWEPRARTFEAVQEWSKGDLMRSLERMVPNEEAAASPCSALPAMRSMLAETAAQGDWTLAVQGMKEAQLDEEELASRWRLQAGRSALQPAVPASAASR